MSHETHPARLLGGPYEGDDGQLYKPLPDLIWAAKCASERCQGVHWFSEDPDKLDVRVADVERYHQDRERNGVMLYVWADARLESDPSARADARAGRELQPA